MSDFVTVATTTDNREIADRIAQTAVERRLAACARISPATSIYRWKGVVETADEHLVEMKTTAARLRELEALIEELHSYDLPEIVVHPIVGGSRAYLDWLANEASGD